LAAPYNAVLIAGPTASGKSAAALALAEALNGVVINADSMQVYREVRILSARPSEADERRVPHLLYGHVAATEPYSVGRYQSDAAAALAKAQASHRLPIFTGGTGLYFAALTDGLAAIPAVPAAIRAQARERLAELGVAGLHADLAARDPQTAAGLRPSDPQRILRAWEVLEATGRPLSDWQRHAGTPVLEGLNPACFVLDVPRPVLRARIAERFQRILEDGAMAEAATLSQLDPTLPAAKILGLRELKALADGTLPQATAITATVTATRQFAKRQVTWFRHRMANWNWVEVDDSGNFVSSMRQTLS
jgi:tRNA dimethylallyltransferase